MSFMLLIDLLFRNHTAFKGMKTCIHQVFVFNGYNKSLCSSMLEARSKRLIGLNSFFLGFQYFYSFTYIKYDGKFRSSATWVYKTVLITIVNSQELADIVNADQTAPRVHKLNIFSHLWR